MAYMASRNNGNSNEMRQGGSRNNYSEMRGGSRNEYNEMRGGNQENYDEMRRGGHGNRSEYGEMRGEYGGAENRYRGRDGRWKAGRRRSEFEDIMGEEWQEEMPQDARAYDPRNEYQPQRNEYGRAESRYKPDYPIAPREEGEMRRSRQIGFGNDLRGDYEARSHYGGQEGGKGEDGMIQGGGMFWMKNPEHEKLDKQKIEKWVHSMTDDKDKPIQPWSAEEIKPLAMRFGYPGSGEEFENFYAVIHMMKSDYCAVAEEFDVNTPAFYAAMADAWLKDPDAEVHGREKLEAYHKYIVKGKK